MQNDSLFPQTFPASGPHHLQSLLAPPPSRRRGRSLQAAEPRSPAPHLPAGRKGRRCPITSFSRTFPASRSRLHCPHRPHPHPWRNPRRRPREDPARPPSCLPVTRVRAAPGLSSPGKLSRRGKVTRPVDQSKAYSKSCPRRGENAHVEAGPVREEPEVPR